MTGLRRTHSGRPSVKAAGSSWASIWGTWLQTPEGKALSDGQAALADASPDQQAWLLTAIVRSDRFVEGSLAGAFESGLLSRIARRAAVLAADHGP